MINPKSKKTFWKGYIKQHGGVGSNNPYWVFEWGMYEFGPLVASSCFYSHPPQLLVRPAKH